jgi:hypothetical protein
MNLNLRRVVKYYFIGWFSIACVSGLMLVLVAHVSFLLFILTVVLVTLFGGLGSLGVLALIRFEKPQLFTPSNRQFEDKLASAPQSMSLFEQGVRLRLVNVFCTCITWMLIVTCYIVYDYHITIPLSGILSTILSIVLIIISIFSFIMGILLPSYLTKRKTSIPNKSFVPMMVTIRASLFLATAIIGFVLTFVAVYWWIALLLIFAPAVALALTFPAQTEVERMFTKYKDV